MKKTEKARKANKKKEKPRTTVSSYTYTDTEINILQA